MSRFILTFDIDRQKEVIKAVKALPGVMLAGIPQADGTVIVRTTTRTLDDETIAIRNIEDIQGVIDLRLMD